MKINPLLSLVPDQDDIDHSNAALNPVKKSRTMSDSYKKRDDTTPVIIKSNTRFIFGYQSKLRVAWDLLIILTAIYLCISIPFYLSFSSTSISSPVIFSFHLFICFLFLIDIVLSFRTSYLTNSTTEEIKNSTLIMKHYGLSLKFMLDLISVIPFELFTSTTYLGLLRLVKIIKLYRLSNIISVIKVRYRIKLVLEFFLILLILLLFIHFSACLFFIVVDTQESWIPPEDYPKNKTEFFGKSAFEQYWIIFYHSVEFIAGIQNGGESNEQFIFFTFFYIIGIIFMAILLGNITVIIRSLKNEDTLFNKTQAKIISAIKKLRLPNSVKYKVNEFFIANYNSLKLGNEYTKFVRMLPPSLVREVNTFYLNSIIQKNPVIAGDKKILKFALVRLKSLMIHPGVRIISQFDKYSYLYFIAQGICNIEVMDEEHNSHLMNILQDGDHFGEIGMLFKTESTATVTSVTFTSLGLLSPEHFAELLDVFPKTSEKLMSKIVGYNDCWRVFCKNMIRTVPYLAFCDKSLMIHILYSLQQERFESGQVVVNIGDPIDYVYFIADGELEFFTYVFDKTAGIFLNDSFVASEVVQQEESRVLFPLGSIKTGSVLFYRQSLTKSFSTTSLRAVTGSYLLKLPIDLLENLSRDRPYLSDSITHYKSSLYKFDSIRGESLPISFPIDVIRNEKYASGSSKSYWTGCVKLKNTVIKIIEIKRNLKIVNPWSIKRMVKKLKAMNYAENAGKHDLVRLIANNQVSDDVVKVLDLLEEKEMSQNLLIQFALKANETTVVCDYLAGRIKSCRKKIRKLKGEYEEINTLASLIEKIIMESIRLTQK